MQTHNTMKFIKEEPSLLFSGIDDNLKPGDTYGPVIRDCYIIECCTGGYGSLIIGGNEFELKEGVVAIAPPGIPVKHTAAMKNPRMGVWCAIGGLKVKSILSKAGITPSSPYVQKECVKEVTETVEEMANMQKDSDPGAELRRTALVYKLLGAIMRYSSAPDTDSIIERAIGFMETEHHRAISVSEIAQTVGFERSYFSTLFKRRTGVSPHAYLESLRIRKAGELMREEGYSSKEAAFAVGIDPINFSRTFKRIHGKTPKEFLEEE